MLRILMSKDWIACRNEILNRIKEDVANEKTGRILMVPELISHDTERRLCQVAGDTVSRFAEVLSFPRLASRVAEQTGNGAVQCLDNGGRIVTMAAAMRQLHSRLKVYASAETKPEFLTELVDAVDEFKRCCITSQDLMYASTQTEGTLAQKLEELALILEAYDALCAQGRRDPRDQMTCCLEQLQDNHFAAEHVFYIDGFPDYTRQHLAILEHLIGESPMVTVGINCDVLNSDALAFEKAADTAAQLIACAKKAGIPVEIQNLNGRDDGLQHLCTALFQGKLPAGSEIAGRVSAVVAETEQTEVHFAADRVMELVKSGCRYRDISIVCGDMGLYENIVRMVFRRRGIPAYQSGTEDILQKTVISTVLAATEAAVGGFEQQAVLRYLKSILSPLDTNTCDLVENYVITWGIRGNAFLKPWDKHPGGIGREWRDWDTNLLSKLNAARERAIEPLGELKQQFKNAKNLADQVEALYAFLERISLAKRLQDLEDQMEQAGDYREAQILNQLWDILLSALEQMHEALGQTVWEPEIFIRLLTLMLSQYTVGTIPPVLDAVMVGPVSAMRLQEAKHLIVLGADEGAMPSYTGSKGLLSDQERVLLRKIGVPLTGGAIEGLQAEFAEIYGVFCGATETIRISHADGDASYLYRRVAEAVGEEIRAVESAFAIASDERDAAAYLASVRDRKSAKTLGLDALYQDAEQKINYEFGNVSPESIRGLYDDELNLSASQVDRYAECRLSYFLQYGLGAKERKEYTIDPAEFGNYVHKVLEYTAKDVMEQGGFEMVSLEETLQIAKKHSDAYAKECLAQLDSLRVEYLFHRNWQELEMVIEELWGEMKNAKFRPTSFELTFDKDAQMPAIPIDNDMLKANLRGKVDRLDIWKKGDLHYFRVIDYKTGKKDFDYCDVFNGVGLQMLLYLFALEKSGAELIGGQPVPSGVQYFPARAPLVTADGLLSDEEAKKERQTENRRKGLILKDDEVIAAMDPEDGMPRLSCRRKKDGTLTGDLADHDQFKMLRQYVFTLLSDMVTQIASGNIEANPYTRGSKHNACAFCPYGKICHKDNVNGRRNYAAMKDYEFWAQVAKEVERHGRTD